jgi:peptidoglycan-N-acetylglucosamine deacetylase
MLRLLAPLVVVALTLGCEGCASQSPPESSPELPVERAAVAPPPARPAEGGIALAVTIDDLPFVGPTARGESVDEALARIASVLADRHVPATGFVTCGRLAHGTITPWLERGLKIGNHSTAHRSLDEMGLQPFLEDARACRDTLTAATGEATRYFRYPFLRTGSERSLRDAAAAGLAAMGHEIAHVSIDTSDWVLTEAYAEAVTRGDDERASEIASAYLTHLRLAARHYRRVARERTGDEVAQILLLHANALAADHLGDVLDMLEQEGFDFVSLEQALADSVYEREDDWVDVVGASWLYRIEPADLAGWGWDRGQMHAMQERFEVMDAADPSQRIGRDLSVRAVPGASAWVVEHARPISANSLVLLAGDGTPILADTPWTPSATQELLNWIELRFGRLPELATISHFHADAAGGLAALHDAGVRTVVSEHTAELLADREPAMRQVLVRLYGSDFAGWQIPAPAQTFSPDDGVRLMIGDTTVKVLFLGAAHTADNVVTWFPDEGVLFGGCLVKGGDTLGYLGHADIQAYPDTVRRLQALEPAIVISGHGDRHDPGQLDNTLRLAEAEAKAQATRQRRD